MPWFNYSLKKTMLCAIAKCRPSKTSENAVPAKIHVATFLEFSLSGKWHCWILTREEHEGFSSQVSTLCKS